MDPSALVSPHFTWGEMTRTDSHDPIILQAQESPDDVIAAHIVWAARTLFEPVHDIVGRLRVNSCYRCPALNAAIGGVSTSRHMEGLAADVFPMDVGLVKAYDTIAHAMPWALDQLILEFGRWIHIGAPRPGMPARHQLLMIWAAGQYAPWNPSDARVLALDRETEVA